MDTATINSRIVPYTLEWFKLHAQYFTGSEAWKLMSEPRGKSPKTRFEEHGVKLAQLEAKYRKILPEKLQLKSNLKMKAKIEKMIDELKVLEEKKDDLHLSDTAETYILEKVHGKMTGLVKQGVDNMATQWGIENEPKAKYWYTQLTGRDLLEPYMEMHQEVEGFSCTPDAQVVPEGLVEIKCPYNGAIHLQKFLITNDEYLRDNFKELYWQMVSQMAILDQPWCDHVSFDPRINTSKGFYTYRLERNEEVEAALLERVRRCRELFNDYYTLFTKGE